MKLHYSQYTLGRGVSHIKTKAMLLVSALALMVGGGGTALVLAGAANAATGGFDQYGYNRTARVFVGTCESWAQAKGWTQAQVENYCGAYLNDRLVMKWNKAWDECNANGYDNPDYCAGAMLTNEWNGMVPNGSGETEHFKAIWVGSAGEASPYWRDGGYLIWGNYEAVMDQGMDASGHWVSAHATPNGFGVKPV